MPDHSYFRCGACRLNWPAEEKYLRCPACDTPTADAFTSELNAIMSSREAESLVNRLNFEAFYNDRVDPEILSEHIAAHHRETFEAIISEGGFEPEEIQVIVYLERQLPSAHLNRD